MGLLTLFNQGTTPPPDIVADLQALANKYQVEIKGSIIPFAPPAQDIDIKPQ